jgi:hypothetical protein
MAQQQLVYETFTNPEVNDRLDMTARAMLVDLAQCSDWRNSRDQLVKKLEVMSIVGGLVGSVCLTICLTSIEPSEQLNYFRSPAIVTSAALHIFYCSGVCGASLSLACVLRAVILQAHLLMFTPNLERYVDHLITYHFDAVDTYLTNGIICIFICIPCGITIVANHIFGLGAICLLIYHGRGVLGAWEELLEHNMHHLEEEETRLRNASQRRRRSTRGESKGD